MIILQASFNKLPCRNYQCLKNFNEILWAIISTLMNSAVVLLVETNTTARHC